MKIFNATLNGTLKVITSNSRCTLFTRDNINNATFFLREKLLNGTEVNHNISSNFSSILLGNPTVRININCDKIAINKTIFFKPNATHWTRVTNDYGIFTWSSMD
jgi:hypothetical protein